MPTLEERIAAGFGFSEQTWRRHTHPWSVWTRATVLPLLIVAVWSRVWLGYGCLAPVGLALAWMWLNPRVFPAPRSTRNWASKAVLGERVWLNRRRVPVPARHRVLPHFLSLLAGGGSILVIWGVTMLHPWPTLMGLAIVLAAKFWFLDRMVWLYEDMHPQHAPYAAWLY